MLNFMQLGTLLHGIEIITLYKATHSKYYQKEKEISISIVIREIWISIYSCYILGDIMNKYVEQCLAHNINK